MADTLPLHQANDAVPGWRALAAGLHVTVATEDFATALALVDRIGAIAEEQQHHPDLDLRWGRVHVATTSHDAGGITERDVRLATSVNEVLAEMGLRPETNRVAEIEIAIDAMDIPAVRPFWAAVFGYDDRDKDLVDPESIRPLLWFQQMDEPRPQRNRIHVDVWVAQEEAEARIARAVEAGGRVVSDESAPQFWVLADPEGNEACICTSAQRG
ncbi:MAG TPA: VOC family protein [Lapillicoccus sp.]|nr:VOC family protein [Lapillicoccus sp.]